jgi:hypothetical protein
MLAMRGKTILFLLQLEWGLHLSGIPEQQNESKIHARELQMQGVYGHSLR